MKKIPRKKLYPYWKEFCAIYDEFHRRVSDLEKSMSIDLKHPDMEFLKSEWGGDYFGIGSVDRKVKLVQFDPE